MCVSVLVWDMTIFAAYFENVAALARVRTYAAKNRVSAAADFQLANAATKESGFQVRF
jgi:hypothetical protein